MIGALTPEAASELVTRVCGETRTPFFVYDGARLDRGVADLLTAYEESQLPNPFRLFLPMFTNPNLTLLQRAVQVSPAVGVAVNSLPEARAVLRRLSLAASDLRFVGDVQTDEDTAELADLGVLPYLATRESVLDWSARRRSNGAGLRLDVRDQGTKGISLNEVEGLVADVTRDGCYISALHCYLGTNITDLEPLVSIAESLMEWIARTRLAPREVNLSGGFGFDYLRGVPAFPIREYFRQLAGVFDRQRVSREATLALEPGRILFAPTGAFVTRIVGVDRRSPIVSDIHVDACFAQYPSPKLTATRHRAVLLGPDGSLPRRGRRALCRICGASTLSSDFLLPNEVVLDEPTKGDLLVVLDAGAYGRSGSYSFLGFDLPAEFLVENDALLCVRERDRDPVGEALQPPASEALKE